MNLHSIKRPTQSYLEPGDRASLFIYGGSHEYDGTTGTVQGTHSGYILLQPDPGTRAVPLAGTDGIIYCLPRELRPL